MLFYQFLGNWLCLECLECKQRKIVKYHLSKPLVICIFFLWDINLGIIQGANLYYVTGFVCIMGTIVNRVHKVFSND